MFNGIMEIRMYIVMVLRIVMMLLCILFLLYVLIIVLIQCCEMILFIRKV